MEGAVERRICVYIYIYIPLGFLGVIHRASGSVTFQERAIARGWLEVVTLLYELEALSRHREVLAAA